MQAESARAHGWVQIRRWPTERTCPTSTFIGNDISLVFHGDYLTSFGLGRICEELEAVTALAGQYQVPWELSDAVTQTYRRALARFGSVDRELLAVSLLEEQAGHKLRAAPS